MGKPADQRADARANRDRILGAARDALTDDPRASLNSIAKAAGVGAGTLYRHFPDRDALVLAVYRRELAALAALAPTLLAKRPPLEAFRAWCERLVRFGRMKQGVADALHGARSREDYTPVVDAVRLLMGACERAGSIRPGTDAEEFLMLLGCLWLLPPSVASEARLRRMMALLFRGLGADEVA